MEAEIYGIIPNANRVAFSNAPPAKRLYKPNKVFCIPWKAAANTSPSIPGIGI